MKVWHLELVIACEPKHFLFKTKEAALITAEAYARKHWPVETGGPASESRAKLLREFDNLPWIDEGIYLHRLEIRTEPLAETEIP